MQGVRASYPIVKYVSSLWPLKLSHLHNFLESVEVYVDWNLVCKVENLHSKEFSLPTFFLLHGKVINGLCVHIIFIIFRRMES